MVGACRSVTPPHGRGWKTTIGKDSKGEGEEDDERGEERRIEMSLSKKVRQQELIGHCSTGVAPAAFARF